MNINFRVLITIAKFAKINRTRKFPVSQYYEEYVQFPLIEFGAVPKSTGPLQSQSHSIYINAIYIYNIRSL